MTSKERKYLALCESCVGSMYPGIQHDRIPYDISNRFMIDGLIKPYFPGNTAHKERWVITDAGRAALSLTSPQGDSK